MIQPDDHVKVAVYMWRSMLCALDLNELTFSRSLLSFRKRKPELVLQYDASLQGIGLILSDITTAETTVLLGIASWNFPFDLQGQSRYQNTVEFIAVLMGLMSFARLGYRSVGIRLVGDNTSSLKWSETERFKGKLSLRATIMYTITGIDFDIDVCETEHVPGVKNVVCDQLSRGVAPTQLGFENNGVILPQDDYVDSCLCLCNPLLELSTHTEVCDLWKTTKNILHQLGNAY
jgi:hypothetical protein